MSGALPGGVLLAADEADPVMLRHPEGASPFLLTVDHAGKLLPRALGDLGLAEAERARHIGWDIGIAGTSAHLADLLGATMVAQIYSRLAIDCNRRTDVATSIPEVSEATVVPGNLRLTAAERQARIDALFVPYHAEIVRVLEARAARGQATALVAMHSFTPVFKGVSRPWHVGVLVNRDRRLAEAMLALLAAEGDLVVGDNEPYRVTDESDYAIPVYGERRGLPHVEIEIRQDLIAEAAGQRAWAERLARLLPQALARL